MLVRFIHNGYILRLCQAENIKYFSFSWLCVCTCTGNELQRVIQCYLHIISEHKTNSSINSEENTDQPEPGLIYQH